MAENTFFDGLWDTVNGVLDRGMDYMQEVWKYEVAMAEATNTSAGQQAAAQLPNGSPDASLNLSGVMPWLLAGLIAVAGFFLIFGKR